MFFGVECHLNVTCQDAGRRGRAQAVAGRRPLDGRGGSGNRRKIRIMDMIKSGMRIKSKIACRAGWWARKKSPRSEGVRRAGSRWISMAGAGTAAIPNVNVCSVYYQRLRLRSSAFCGPLEKKFLTRA